MNAKKVKNTAQAAKTKARPAASGRGTKNADAARMPMGRYNYTLMAIGFAVIVLGFILMTGGGDNDPDIFDAERLYSFRRITLAPILVLGGFALEIYAIMARPKPKKEE